jgi:hypothetical protein
MLKVKIIDFSHGGDATPAIKRDLRQAGNYFVLSEGSTSRPDLEINADSVNKGGDDEHTVLSVKGENGGNVETLREILVLRFSPECVYGYITPKPKELIPWWQDRRTLDFLDYMRGFEGVDFT